VRAFSVGDRVDLAPEGIAHDPETDRFFVGSMRTGEIFAIEGGSSRPFATLSIDGTPVSTLGLAVDPARRRLWAIGTALDLHEAWKPEQEGLSALFGLDLATGEVRERHVRAPGGEGPGFNDLAVGADGAIYLSGIDVHVVRPGDDAPSLLGVRPPIRSSNGIAIGADPNVLYVAADQRGIARVDLGTLERTWLATPDGVELRAFDGLYRTDGGLVGVQYGLGRWRVVRLDLDPTGAAVTGIEVLEQENPEISGATTGVPVGGDLFFVARDLPPAGVEGPWAGRAAVWRTPIRP
jgi:sugar lactone lactonase YvrE